MDHSFEVIVAEVNKKEKVELNRLFTSRFEIKNLGKDWKEEDFYVIESGKQQGKRVSALKKG